MQRQTITWCILIPIWNGETGAEQNRSFCTHKTYVTEEGKGAEMKGYNTSSGYMGYVNGSYVLFVSEAEYRDYMEDAA